MPTRNLHINVALEALEMHEDAVLVRVADERIAALMGWHWPTSVRWSRIFHVVD